jgi:hypothetical protein
MWLLRTSLKILFPRAGVKAVLRDIDDALARSVGSPTSAEEPASPAALPSYVECRVQHTTEVSIAACAFHSRSENTPQWLRTERFAATWKRRQSTPGSPADDGVQHRTSTGVDLVGSSQENKIVETSYKSD